MNNYKQITKQERNLIEYLYVKAKKPISFIAQELNRHRSTIWRELKRNTGKVRYFANDAQFDRSIKNLNSHANKIKDYSEFIAFFERHFNRLYNGVDVCVQQAKQARIETPTTQTVYNWIHLGYLKVRQKDLLRPRFWWKKSNKYRKYLYELSKMNEIPITYRPKNINERTEFGHYEIDLVIGKNHQGSILTLVERMTRKAFTSKLLNKTMHHVNEKLMELIQKNNLKIKSITKDNGMEFQLLYQLTQSLKIDLYTCHTYASCEKGTNENFNGLLRRYFTKITNFNQVSEIELNHVTNIINKMPRRILSYKSAHQFFEAING